MKQMGRQFTRQDIKKLEEESSFLKSWLINLDVPEETKDAALKSLGRMNEVIKAGEPPKNSQNSHIPSSKDISKPEKDPPEDPKSGKNTKKPGGQKGHKGATYKLEPNPDVTEVLKPEDVNKAEGDWKLTGVIIRQLVDVEIIKKVTQFEQYVYKNINTGQKVRVDFPDGVNAPMNFGDTLKAIIVYLRDENHLPYDRIKSLVNDVFGIKISTATIVSAVKDAENSITIENYEEAACKNILESPVNRADETGMNVNGNGHWAHVLASSSFVTFIAMERRGLSAMNEIGLLGSYTGILVHDCYASYFKFPNLTHAICNAHIVRELNLASEMGQNWAKNMKEHLLDLNKLKIEYGGEIPLDLQKSNRDTYKDIIEIGYSSTGGRDIKKPPGEKLKRGRIKKPKYRNLLERLERFEDGILRFMTDKSVPFTNNDAERVIRMLKVRMKVSGKFNSLASAQRFCSMYGYLVTCKKNGVNAFEACRMTVIGQTPDFIMKELTTGKDSLNAA